MPRKLRYTRAPEAMTPCKLRHIHAPDATTPCKLRTLAPPRPRSRVNYATFAPPRPRSPVNYTKFTLPKLRTHPAEAAPKRHPLSRAKKQQFLYWDMCSGGVFRLPRCLLNSALYPQPQVFENNATRQYFLRWPHATRSRSKRASNTQ